jgi:hypothetical protein
MSIRLRLAELHVPAVLKSARLRELVARTARAFSVPTPDFRGLSLSEAVAAYARFTRDQADRIAAGGNHREAARDRLRQEAFAFAEALRVDLRIRTREDALRAARLLYRILGIDFHGTPTGEVRIDACSFSRLYSPATCAIMSGMDEGFLAGLAGAGTLEFITRITEGSECCRGRFRFPERLA